MEECDRMSARVRYGRMATHTLQCMMGYEKVEALVAKPGQEGSHPSFHSHDHERSSLNNPV